jgi:ribulose-bisphosphate carboxylase large chain
VERALSGFVPLADEEDHPLHMPNFFEATYRLHSQVDDVASFAEALLLEQTFETPRSVVKRYPQLSERNGAILSIAETPDASVIRMSLPDDVASESPAQFLNVLFGNASLHCGLELVDVEPSNSLLAMLGGPNFGVDGIRERIGVRDRPLTCSAIKPVGLHLEELVTLFRALAEGGIDIIKDDHYLGDHPDARFEERVRTLSELASDIGARQNRTVWYVPNLTGTPDQISQHLDLAQEASVPAVMVAPSLMGLPAFHALRQKVDVPIFAHPSFSGSHSMSPHLVWGKLPRLFGADASIFANHGGRFSLSQTDGRTIAAMLAASMPGIKRSFPVPAGGISVDAAEEVIRLYGNDVILLVGGSLLSADDLTEASRRFVARVREASLLTA